MADSLNKDTSTSGYEGAGLPSSGMTGLQQQGTQYLYTAFPLPLHIYAIEKGREAVTLLSLSFFDRNGLQRSALVKDNL